MGHVVTFERNKRFVWRGRFALFSWVWIGTDLTFTPAPEGTRVKEILYFEMPPHPAPAALLFIWRKAFRPQACREHIVAELSGVKTMLEAGDHDPADIEYAFDDPAWLGRIKRYAPQEPRAHAA